MPAIDTDGLTKRYDGTVAVDSIDLSVPRGTVFGFLGPNGAGKTTTIRMLVTLLRPTSGTARIAGHPIEDRPAVTERIGFLPESPPPFGELLDRFDLAADADRRISAYSKGMKRKTGIIQAILHEPEVVFLDEPTAGLDPRAARTVRDTISDLAAEEATVFLSTHILPVVDELADIVGVLFDGDLVAQGTPEDLARP